MIRKFYKAGAYKEQLFDFGKSFPGLKNKAYKIEHMMNKKDIIINVDYSMIEEYDKNQNYGKYSTTAKERMDRITGVCLFKDNLRYVLDEIKDMNGNGSIKTSYITKKTEKAYYIEELNTWIPKSQTYMKGDELFIKRWIIKNIRY